MRGFVGPADIFRNPEAIFCLFEPPAESDASPFDLTLAAGGDDFAVMGMHFKLGLYEHQSAGAIAGLIDLLTPHPALLDDADRSAGDANHDLRAGLRHHRRSGQTRSAHPAKRRPLDGLHHRHAAAQGVSNAADAGWQELMLMPDDYDDAALLHPLTRRSWSGSSSATADPSTTQSIPTAFPRRSKSSTPRWAAFPADW